jgi:hypothetical protein
LLLEIFVIYFIVGRVVRLCSVVVVVVRLWLVVELFGYGCGCSVVVVVVVGGAESTHQHTMMPSYSVHSTF